MPEELKKIMVVVKIDLAKRLSPSRTALIIIDIQNDFCHSGGGFAMMGHDVSKLQTVVEPVKLVSDTARKLSVPVIFIQTEHDRTNNSEAWLQRADWGPNSPLCQTDTWGADLYSLKSQESDIVVIKHRYSAFAGTSLEQVLRSLQRDSLPFTGLTTSICVDSSLRDGLMRDFHVALLADGCAELSPEKHNFTLDIVQNYFGPVLSSSEVLDIWMPESG